MLKAENALTRIVEYILESEYENYRTYCEENELDARNIRGDVQGRHVYALALIGLGMEFNN
jgi:hypothetical protein